MSKRKISGPGLGRWLLLAALVIVIPLLTINIYLELDPKDKAEEKPAQQQAGAHDINAMVKRLERRLLTQPDDGEGWLMLGRSYLVLGHNDQAVTALTYARNLLGNTPAVLLAQAQALAATVEPPAYTGKPAQLLELVLAQAPENAEALWFSGVAAAQQGDYATAVTRWEDLLALQPPGSSDADVIRENLQAVRARLDTSEPQTRASAGTQTSDASKAQAQASLQISVSLASTLSDQAQPGDTVFILARALQGPAMPLAVVKRQVRDLPLTIALDDNNAMTPGAGISSYDQVEVLARISKSGGVKPQPGDLQATPQTVKVSASGLITLIIDSVVR